MRRSTTAALNERGYIFVGAPGCPKQFRGAVDAQESSRSPWRGKSSRLRPSTIILSRSAAISLKIIFWKGEELIWRDSVTAVQQGAALQQRENFHG
jgi:hypothetical protein